MRYAVVNENIVEAKIGLKAFCLGCSEPVIAKCGTKKVHHWAHRANRMCDDWWEPETQWHRDWKNNFPAEWQEVFLPDSKTGEKHIADTRTPDGLVIEFQHSHIDPTERLIREKFYKTMVWVVDGTRLKRDFPRFLKGKKDFHDGHKPNIYYLFFPEDCFPSAWLKSSVPVIFDFLGTETNDENIGLKSPLYCLFPVQVGQNAVVAEISRKAFISSVTKGEWLSRAKGFIDELKLIQRKLDEERQRKGSNWITQYSWSPRYKRRYF